MQHFILFGGTGFLGQVLGEIITKKHPKAKITTISRSPAKYEGKLSYPCKLVSTDDFLKDPKPYLAKENHVINLAGAGIMDHRWSSSFKKTLVQSRVDFTRDMVKALLPHVEQVSSWIQSSGIGYYGNRGSHPLDESSTRGEGFLADMAAQWEGSSKEITGKVPCSAWIRYGMILGETGGPLQPLASVYHLGLGARFGSGKQYAAWIYVEDAANLILHCIEKQSKEQVVNGVAPQVCQQFKMHQLFSKASGRPNLTILPRFVARVVMGENCELVFQSQNAKPQYASETGYRFVCSSLEECLQKIYKDTYGKAVLSFEIRQFLKSDQSKVWNFFSDENNLEKLTPDQLGFKILPKSTPKIEKGTTIQYQLSLHGIPIKWKTLISDWQPENSFTDEQIKGPYKLWRHSHRFTASEQGTLMIDHVDYKLPLGWLGALGGFLPVQYELRKIFKYRKEQSSLIFK